MKRFVAVLILAGLMTAPVWAASKSQNFKVSVYIPPIAGVNDHLAKNNEVYIQMKESQELTTIEETMRGTEWVTLKSVTVR